MKVKTIYFCDHCDFSSPDQGIVKRHEAEHFGLTLDIVHEYLTLQRKVGEASFIRKNKDTDDAYDLAVQELLEFEKKHNITEEAKKKYNLYS